MLTLGDKKLKGFHPLKFLTPVIGLVNICYGLTCIFYPSVFVGHSCLADGECLFRVRAAGQYTILQGLIWVTLLFMDRNMRYIWGWLLAINAFAFLANTNIGWATGFVPNPWDALFAPAGAAYFRSLEAIFGFWIAIRAFEPEEGFAAAEAKRKSALKKIT